MATALGVCVNQARARSTEHLGLKDGAVKASGLLKNHGAPITCTVVAVVRSLIVVALLAEKTSNDYDDDEDADDSDARANEDFPALPRRLLVLQQLQC